MVQKLEVEMIAKTAQFAAAMKSQTAAIDKMNRSASGLSTGLKRVAGFIGGVFAVQKVVGYARGVALAADEQNKLSRRLGVTKSDVDALELSFTKGGASLQESVKDFDIFNRKLGELEAGETSASEAFGRLGLSMQDMAGKSYTDKLVMIKKSLDGMSLSARAFSQQELFGRGGKNVFEGLEGLEDANQLMKEINESLGITGDDVKTIEAMNDEFTETAKRMELITTAIITKLSPAILDATTKFGEMLISANNAATGAASALGKGFEAMGARAEGEGGGIGGWLKGIGQSALSRVGIGASDTEVLASAENKRLLEAGATPETAFKQATAKFDTNQQKAIEESIKKEQEQQSVIDEEKQAEALKFMEKYQSEVDKLNEELDKVSALWSEGFLPDDIGQNAVKELKEKIANLDPDKKAAAEFIDKYRGETDKLNEEKDKILALSEKGLISGDVANKALSDIDQKLLEESPEYKMMKEQEEMMGDLMGDLMGDTQEPMEKKALGQAGVSSGGVGELLSQAAMGARANTQQQMLDSQRRMQQLLERIAMNTENKALAYV